MSLNDEMLLVAILGFLIYLLFVAISGEKNVRLVRLVLQNLSTSAKGFEGSHPKFIGIVNSFCLALSNVGI